ncbi:MAG: glycosyltransferase family 1 protein [Ignavibacteriaceae bacterium]|nr:glycosyltransferase family 1 protein [Ignavibacteriaceae bacterium]
MRIGFYIHHSMLKAGGIFTYSIGILRLLLKSDEIKSIVLFTSPEVKKNLTEFDNKSKIEFSILNRNSFFTKIRFALSYFLFDTYTVYNKYSSGNKFLNFLKKFSISINPYNSLLKKSGISLFHVPIQYSPIYGTKIPVIITMHDLQEFHFPENFSSAERIHRTINNHKAMYEADKIIVSFEHIKKDIIKFYNVSENKVSVCPPPFAENWFTTKKETDWQSLEKKYSISKKYLLYPAATWPHKNHLRMLEAFKEVQKRIPDLKLNCTGNKTDYFKTIENKIKELEIENSVKFLGIVPEEDLVGLYKNAELVVIPTLYEAGSGPLYEAMRYEVPVICAKTTSLPETIGDERFVFDPKNTEDLANLIDKMLTDDKLRAENLLNSKKRMSELSKYDYFNNFWEVYKKLVNH